MSSNFEISRKIRHVRDFIFNATFKGMWLYSPFESLAFDWMQLVSAQIQSVSYNPIKFLEDIEDFAAHVRCVDGIESDRVETFDDRIQVAMKEVKGGLASNNWDLCQQVVKDNAVVLGQKRKGSEKSSIKAKSLSDHCASSGDGVTKLFESAVDAAIKPTISDIKSPHDTSRAAAIEDSAERVSRIFQSLHDYGAQLGYLMSAESIKKEKSADLKGTIRNLSTLTSLKKQLPLSRMTVSDIKCRSSSSSNAIPLPSKLSKSKTLHEQPSETLTVTRKLAPPIVVKKTATVEKRNKEFTDSTPPLKRAKLAGDHVLSASWLKVDLSRGPNGPSKNSSSPLGQTTDSTFPLESGQIDSGRFNSEAEQESLTAAGTATIEDQTNVIKSKYIGVHALMKVCNQKTRTGSGSSGPATTSAGELDFVARVLLLGRDVNLGMFSTEEAAARAHDRALIRAIGPSNCRTINLNFPVSEYSCEPLSRFMEFDEKLKGQLFATAWTGLKHCDFGFLLIRGAQNQGHASLHMQHQVQKLALLSSALGTGTGTDTSSASNHAQATHSRTNAKVAATVKGGLRMRSGSSTSASAGSLSAAAAPSSSASSSSSNDAIIATAPPSFAFTSVSLKSKIVKEADVQRNKVAPPVFGALLSVSNVPSINSISQAGSRGSRGWLAAKHEKIPMQRAIYLGPHTVPGRCVLGFFEGSRVIAGATFLQRFPEGIYTGVIACEVTNSYDEQDSALKEMYRELIDRTGRQGTVLPHVTGAPIPLTATEETQSSSEVCNSAELDDAVPSSVGTMKDDSNSRGACPCPSTPHSHVDHAITTTLPCTTHLLNLLPATSRIVESIDCEMSQGSAAIGGMNCYDDGAFTSRDDVSSRSMILDGPLPTEASIELATLHPELIPVRVSSGEMDINKEASSFLSTVQSSLSASAPSLVLKSCASPTKVAAFPDATLASSAATREVVTESLSSPHSCEPKQANSKLHWVGRPQMETRIDDHIQVSSLWECGGIGAEVESNASRAGVMSSNTIPTLVQVSAEPMRQKNTCAVQIMPCPVIQPHSISLRELIFGGLASAASPIRPVPVPVNLLVDLPAHLPLHVPVPVLPSIPHQQHIIKRDQSSHIAELALASSSPPKLVTPIITTASTSSLSSSTASITAAQDGDGDKVINASPTVSDTCEDTSIVGTALLADCIKNNEGQRKEGENEKEEEREVKKKEKEEEREGKKKEKEDEKEERRKDKKEKKEKKDNEKNSKKRRATETAEELEVSEGILSQKKQKKESKKSSPVICEIVREKRKYTKRNQNVSVDIVAQTHAHARGQSESEVMDSSGEAHPSGDIAEEVSPKDSDAPTVDDEEEIVEESSEEEEDVEEDETPWTAASLLQLMSYRPIPSAQTESSGTIDQHSNGRSRRSSATNPATNLDYFNLNFEKHRLNEISHYTCFALGEEAKRLRACLRACESAGVNRNEKGFKMYRTTALMKTDWERSIEDSSLQADGLSRRAALTKLRSAIVVLLSRGREESEGIDILCPPQIFRGVQAADSSMTETDGSVVPVSVIAPAHTILPNTRYVAADLFATGARFLGLFASPLEAALVREQILDREGYLVKKKKRALEDRSSTKNLENFNNSQWAMVTDMTALMESFIREQCLL